MKMQEDLAYTFERKDLPVRLIGYEFKTDPFLVFDETDDLIGKAKELLDYAAQDNYDFVVTNPLRRMIKDRRIRYKIFRINNRRILVCSFGGKSPIRKIRKNGKIAIVVFNNRYIGYID